MTHSINQLFLWFSAMAVGAAIFVNWGGALAGYYGLLLILGLAATLTSIRVRRWLVLTTGAIAISPLFADYFYIPEIGSFELPFGAPLLQVLSYPLFVVGSEPLHYLAAFGPRECRDFVYWEGGHHIRAYVVLAFWSGISASLAVSLLVTKRHGRAQNHIAPVESNVTPA